MKLQTKSITRRGGVSLYLVIFTTLVLSIVTLSFIRVMIKNSERAINMELSQSALDSAQAGVEDARIAVLKYHKCLGTNSNSSDCKGIINAMKNNNCDTVSNILKRSKDSESESVIIQETKDSSTEGNSADMLQAYTCVKMSEDLDDYRTTLTQENHFRVIPIKTETDADGNMNLDNIAAIEVNWFSSANSEGSISYSDSKGLIEDNPSTPSIPILNFQLFQTDQSFRLSELNAGNAYNNKGQLDFDNVNKGTDHFSIFLNPIEKNSDDKTRIYQQALKGAGNKTATKQKLFNTSCKSSFENSRDEFLCHARLTIPSTWNGGSRNQQTMFIIIATPFNSNSADVSITLKDYSDNVINFKGVQALVDSTGRANDVYRRVETRLDLSDINFPYPEFEIEQSTTSNPINKTTSIADKCWYTVTSSNGKVQIKECPVRIP